MAKGTLLNWEHGRRHPTGPAQGLLAMIAKPPGGSGFGLKGSAQGLLAMIAKPPSLVRKLLN